ncbi:hypothetical protein FN976_07900 [Caenimonas sedimenti]|uniref:Helix-turn-helix domain-containing protein n=1 Tax=Caenimonas sedimenti TaxID=2596921 RepID=A0A562ZUC5_9BURK|nr:hypothetical protein [Caenimonas sedimenti]TWO71905.1 hypothetical protein FN976_07900 [Caenimonas sedimenti]
MAWQHCELVWSESKQSGTVLLVLLYVAQRLNMQTGSWDISVAEIARACRLSERQAARSLAALKVSGELVSKRHGGIRGYNRFWLGLSSGGSAGEQMAAQAGRAGQLPSMAGAPVTNDRCPPTAIDGRGYLTSVAVLPVADVGSNMTSATPVLGLSQKLISLEGEVEVMRNNKFRDIAAALRKSGSALGSKANASLREALRLGAELSDIVAARSDAEASGAGDPLAYGLASLVNRLRQTAAHTSSVTVVAEWDCSRSSIEAEGVRRGLGTWDEKAFHSGKGESFLTYTGRVRVAREPVARAAA